jgi:hypothetical protein
LKQFGVFLYFAVLFFAVLCRLQKIVHSVFAVGKEVFGGWKRSQWLQNDFVVTAKRLKNGKRFCGDCKTIEKWQTISW